MELIFEEISGDFLFKLELIRRFKDAQSEDFETDAMLKITGILFIFIPVLCSF